LIGSGDADYLDGGDGNDRLISFNNNAILYGGAGNDNLVGGTGNDILTGGEGSDRFTFNSPTEGIDQITDFSVPDDTINVSAAGFGGGLVAGAAITSAQFYLGTNAHDTSDRFIYDRTNGFFFFDPDGTGAIAQIHLATLNTELAMTNTDIFVIA
jgi:Ca2+-binding RTX toxin-like protein